MQQRRAAVRTAQVQSASRYIQVPSQQLVAAVRTAQVQSTSRYIQVPLQRDQLLLPGGQSLRIGGWGFARRPAQLPVLCDSFRIGGWSFARSPAQLPVLGIS